MLDMLKDQGFKYSTVAGFTVSIADIPVVSGKAAILGEGDEKVANINAMYVTPNPASDSVKFIVAHDCPGNSVEVSIDVMDAAGRLLWTTSETTATSDMTYATTWDLTLDTGAKLQTGVYLYRVRIFSDAKKYTSKAKKLVVVRK